MMNSDTPSPQVTFGAGRLTIEQVVALAERRARPALNADPAFMARVQRGADFLDRLLAEEGVIYGVTTGYGDSVTRAVPPTLVAELPLHLTRFHGCGLGEDLGVAAGRAVLVTRLCSLAQGVSGVSQALLERLCWLLEQDLIPRIPQEGSVGASGDLTPLSYVAAVLVGERELYRDGRLASTSDVYGELGVMPLRLRPKEGLALMNGTSVMTALACLAYARTEYLMRLATRITALVSVAMEGNAFHFDERLFAAKPHPGMQNIAAWLRADLRSGELPRHSDRLQDRYSLRCAPHVIGVVADSLPWWRQLIENELNSANDNPLIDGDFEHVMHGGHFYGGHIAMAMDSMKTAVANLADLLDRQLAQLVDVKFNGGLPSNLSGASGERRMINHGFKAVQIGVSAWTAEALKLTMPASVFSRSTECHNQDKVSMGTIAARDALRVLTLTEQVGAACLLAAVQGVELRLGLQHSGLEALSQPLREMVLAVREDHPALVEDRPLEQELRALIARLQARHYDLYEETSYAE
ncbi:aromatic amino acid ammonia-lyase [Aeromonas sp. FDAARGOS 1409]|uniref:HAL/PAL/TAL family ammonia-lyase n=2 Tax=Aeromonas TaxID=642 RepID=UPI001C2282BA|nr:aromatic amino acid ammonia-lyase [Aeromonas sp. FDAARGOS 1409]QXC28521.1 aromatic amino acid ammonia-lyase [Aeromonas sp. FDAARGOS 1409]